MAQTSSVLDKDRIARLLPPVLDAATWHDVVQAIRLSPKQAAYVALLMHGLEDKQIASHTDTAYSTLRVHRERMLKRLGVTETNRVVVTTRVFEIAWGARMSETCPHCGRRCERRR